jgi:hypothetical protein
MQDSLGTGCSASTPTGLLPHCAANAHSWLWQVLVLRMSFLLWGSTCQISPHCQVFSPTGTSSDSCSPSLPGWLRPHSLHPHLTQLPPMSSSNAYLTLGCDHVSLGPPANAAVWSQAWVDSSLCSQLAQCQAHAVQFVNIWGSSEGNSLCYCCLVLGSES